MNAQSFAMLKKFQGQVAMRARDEKIRMGQLLSTWQMNMLHEQQVIAEHLHNLTLMGCKVRKMQEDLALVVSELVEEREYSARC